MVCRLCLPGWCGTGDADHGILWVAIDFYACLQLSEALEASAHLESHIPENLHRDGFLIGVDLFHPASSSSAPIYECGPCSALKIDNMSVCSCFLFTANRAGVPPTVPAGTSHAFARGKGWMRCISFAIRMHQSVSLPRSLAMCAPAPFSLGRFRPA